MSVLLFVGAIMLLFLFSLKAIDGLSGDDHTVASIIVVLIDCFIIYGIRVL